MPLAVALAATLPGLLGGRWGVDTGWYAGIAMEALREGHWWTLRAGEDAYFNKPPLAFWILAAFLGVLGPHLWAIRLCMIVAAAGCVLLTAAIGRRLAGPRVGVVSGVVLALTPEFFRNADRYRLDYWQLLLMLAAVWCVAAMARPRSWRRVAPGDRRTSGSTVGAPERTTRVETGTVHAAATHEIAAADRRRSLALATLAGGCVGLALLTKPFMALGVVPVLAIWLIAANRAGPARWLAWVLVVAVAVAAPWHSSMVRLHGEAFVGEYFRNQSVARALGGFENEPWWHYLAYLARNHWPWLAVLALALARPRPGMYRSRAFAALAIVWPLVWFIALSAFGDKRKQYLLPVYPGLAWVCGAWLAAAAPTARGKLRRARRAIRRAPMPMLAVSAVAAMAVMPFARRRGTAEWEALYDFMRAQGIREMWRGHLSYDDAGMVYVKTGVWPRRLDGPDGRGEPPGGAWVLYDDAPRVPPEAEAVWARRDLVVARWRGAGAIR